VQAADRGWHSCREGSVAACCPHLILVPREHSEVLVGQLVQQLTSPWPTSVIKWRDEQQADP
jgi:hypothetical protein